MFTVEQGEKEGEGGGGGGGGSGRRWVREVGLALGSGIEDPSILAHSSTLSYYTSKHS